MEEEFNSLTCEYGGRYIPGKNSNDGLILDSLKQIMAFKNRIVRDVKCLPDIYIDIINSPDLNASAFLSRSGKYFIGINKGVIEILENDFTYAVNHDKFYEESNMSKANSNIYKEMCLKFALQFLVAHEISHIRFGHLKYKNTNSNLAEYTVMQEAYSEHTDDDMIFYQTLEMDADCCGITTVFNRIMQDRPLIANSDPISIAITQAELEILLYCLSFSVNYINEKLFSPIHKVLRLESISHPHPGIRQFYITTTITTAINDFINPAMSDSLSKVTAKALSSVMGIMHQIDFNKEKFPIYMAFTKKGNMHTKRIVNNWKDVREVLKPYSYDELAPYEEFLCNIPILD